MLRLAGFGLSKKRLTQLVNPLAPFVPFASWNYKDPNLLPCRCYFSLKWDVLDSICLERAGVVRLLRGALRVHSLPVKSRMGTFQRLAVGIACGNRRPDEDMDDSKVDHQEAKPVHRSHQSGMLSIRSWQTFLRLSNGPSGGHSHKCRQPATGSRCN